MAILVQKLTAGESRVIFSSPHRVIEDSARNLSDEDCHEPAAASEPRPSWSLLDVDVLTYLTLLAVAISSALVTASRRRRRTAHLGAHSRFHRARPVKQLPGVEVDLAIAEVIEYLLASGVTTVGSCQGGPLTVRDHAGEFGPTAWGIINFADAASFELGAEVLRRIALAADDADLHGRMVKLAPVLPDPIPRCHPVAWTWVRDRDDTPRLRRAIRHYSVIFPTRDCARLTTHLQAAIGELA